uniref:Putative secreted protein n=1 Tax=Ixodes ricinus TaxID=34613 RepID=A0A6B0U2P3_IXORI
MATPLLVLSLLLAACHNTMKAASKDASKHLAAFLVEVDTIQHEQPTPRLPASVDEAVAFLAAEFRFRQKCWHLGSLCGKSRRLPRIQRHHEL